MHATLFRFLLLYVDTMCHFFFFHYVSVPHRQFQQSALKFVGMLQNVRKFKGTEDLFTDNCEENTTD